MNKSIDLKEVLRLHERWSEGYADGRCADLSQEDLSYADLCGANLSYANLRGADLHEADLSYANLRGADLHEADLRCAYLGYADLRGAKLIWADLGDADLGDADLIGANLHDANLRCATFDDHIVCLDRIGSAKRRTTYNATKDIVWCGCFTGTFKKWVAKIRKTYPDENNVYRKEYEAAIAYFKAIAKANKGVAQNG